MLHEEIQLFIICQNFNYSKILNEDKKNSYCEISDFKQYMEFGTINLFNFRF